MYTITVIKVFKFKYLKSDNFYCHVQDKYEINKSHNKF